MLKKLWLLAEQLLPESRSADYTQAMMDLGAMLCTSTKPRCLECPLSSDCRANLVGSQTDYPTKKPKKTLPEKETIMLIIQDKQHAVYMQKRPPSGIWGGLWCFPQFENHDSAKQWLQEQLSESSVVIEELAVLSHTFSHFRLHIQPLIIACETPLKMSVMEKDQSLWYNINTEFDGGLAAPVQQLINQLKERQNGTNG